MHCRRALRLGSGGAGDFGLQGMWDLRGGGETYRGLNVLGKDVSDETYLCERELAHGSAHGGCESDLGAAQNVADEVSAGCAYGMAGGGLEGHSRVRVISRPACPPAPASSTLLLSLPARLLTAQLSSGNIDLGRR